LGDPAKEPLCTLNELLGFVVICVVYSSILFSVDPEWVGWAAPLVFGGALYAGDPPPASAHLGSPHDVLLTAYLGEVVSLLGIVLVALVRDKRHLNWLSWLKRGVEIGNIARVRSFLRSRLTFTSER
jgi:hypothetical protein